MSYPRRSAIASLLIANFLVSLGYGVLLPVLPGIVAQLDTGASRSDAIWHTGLVTAAYTGTALVIALFWGRLSDRLFNSTMIVLPLLLTGAATIAGIFATSLWSLYFWRIVAGAGAGAIGPASQAWTSRWAASDAAWQTRRVVSIGIAANTGLFFGPFLGGLATTTGSWLKTSPGLALQLPALAAGTLLIATAAVVAMVVRQAPARRQREVVVIRLLRQIAPMLVTLAVTALAIGAFEVALVFMPNGQPMSPFEIGVLFAQCTLIMSAAQSVFFLPRFRDGHLRSFVVPALAMLAAGLTASVFAGGIVGHVVSTSLVAIGGGLLPPVLIREISAIDGGASGSANGFQSAASLAGQTAGAILAGSIAAMIGPRWTFVAAAIAVLTTGVVLVRTKKGTAWKGITP
ncbi:MAG: MFS transporter [Rhizobiales bacterium]|nr:MFS transporter [Hyphomicrobiales bacterium]